MADHARRFARSSANEVLVPDLDVISARERHRSETEPSRRPGGAAGSHWSPLRSASEKRSNWRKMRELSSKEAAQVIGTSPGALRVSIHRAMKTLRASLAIEAAVNNRAVAG